MGAALTTVLLLACVATIGALAVAKASRFMRSRTMGASGRSFAANDGAFLDLNPMFAVLSGVLGVVVLFALVANLLPTYADSVADVNENLTDPAVTFGDSTADGIKPVFAIAVGLLAVVSIVGALFVGFQKIKGV